MSSTPMPGGFREVEVMGNGVEFEGLARFTVEEPIKEHAMQQHVKVDSMKHRAVAGTVYHTSEPTGGHPKKSYKAKVRVTPYEGRRSPPPGEASA